jgi:arginyl-tRNA synthetase
MPCPLKNTMARSSGFIFDRSASAAPSLSAVTSSSTSGAATWAVAKRLLDFPELVVRAGDACEPHVVAHYLLGLAGEFSRWYTIGNGDKSLRVICDDPALQRARLALTAGVQAALATGLRLLGIAAPDQM